MCIKKVSLFNIFLQLFAICRETLIAALVNLNADYQYVTKQAKLYLGESIKQYKTSISGHQ